MVKLYNKSYIGKLNMMCLEVEYSGATHRVHICPISEESMGDEIYQLEMIAKGAKQLLEMINENL